MNTALYSFFAEHHSSLVVLVCTSLTAGILGAVLEWYCGLRYRRALETHEKFDDAFWQTSRNVLPLMVWSLGTTVGAYPLLRNTTPRYADKILLICLLLVLVLFVTRYFKNWTAYLKFRANETVMTADDRAVAIITRLGWLLILLLAVGLFLACVGVNPVPWLLGIGSGSILIGYLASDAISNFFGGIYIAMDSPFKQGDVISLGTGELCRVERIGWRTTRLYNLIEHIVVIVPNNSMASQSVTNVSEPDSELRASTHFYVPDTVDIADTVSSLIELARGHKEIERTDPSKLLPIIPDSDTHAAFRQEVAAVVQGKPALSRSDVEALQMLVMTYSAGAASARRDWIDMLKLELARDPVAYSAFEPCEAGGIQVNITLHVFVKHLERRLDVINDLNEGFQRVRLRKCSPN